MASDSQQDEQQLLLPIIDSHIHLFPEADAEKQIWWQPGTGFDGPHSVNQFKEAARSSPSLLGFVLIESDMKNAPQPGSSEEYDWTYPLEEAARMARLALGKPQEGDEASPEDARLCLGLVPWAPMTSGPEVLERYISQLQEVVGDAWSKVKGFRFLVQDKPHGTMLEDKFIQNLRLLGRKGLVFDVGVDHHRRGKKQLEELLSMIDLAHDGVPEEERVTFIISEFHPRQCSSFSRARISGLQTK
jgi:L-rhamnono-1,4-lactonase